MNPEQRMAFLESQIQAIPAQIKAARLQAILITLAIVYLLPLVIFLGFLLLGLMYGAML